MDNTTKAYQISTERRDNCARCGQPAPIGSLKFDELEGEPVICARCVFAVIVNVGGNPLMQVNVPPYKEGYRR